MKAFLACMLVSTLLLVLLVSGVLVYLSGILKKETELAAYVLPNLELAHQFSSATAGMQSQGQLLKSAGTTDELIARNQVLEDSIRQTRTLFEPGAGQQEIDTRALANTIDQIQVVVIALFDIREKQLFEAERLQQKIDSTVAQLNNLLDAVHAHRSLLSTRLQKVSKMLSAATTPESNTVEAPNPYVARLQSFEADSLNIHEYLLFTQDLEKLKALVQRLPLVDSIKAVTESKQARDQLVESLSQRTSLSRNNAVQSLLLEPLSDINSQLSAAKNPFDDALALIELGELQKRLSLALTALTDEVPAVAEQIRSQSETILIRVFDETRTGLDAYRWNILGGLSVSLLMLGTVCYWLVYRQAVLPLGQISGQLDSVGTESFTPGDQPYFIQEMSDLSMAVNDLDHAYKEMQHKDVQLKSPTRSCAVPTKI